jgi:hypothetical protein
MEYNLIYTPEYALIVTNKKFKEGDLFLTKEGIIHKNYGYNYGDVKIIGHRPLVPGVSLRHLGIPDLPEFSDEDGCPVGFVTETKKGYRYNDDGERIGFPVHETEELKTTLTPEGYIQIVGTYLY